MRYTLALLILAEIGMAAQDLSKDALWLVGAGYGVPSPVYLAPGQLVTLIANIASEVTPCNKPANPFEVADCTVRAPGGADIPASLDGASVSFFGTVLTSPAMDTSPPLPNLQVISFYVRGFPDPLAAALVAITAQVPFEAYACPTCQPGGISAILTLQTTAGAASQIDAYVYPDQVHVLTSCDSLVQSPGGYTPSTGPPCPSLVTHADGSLVSATSPANAGEELVAYAIGLGQTNPALTTGKLVTAAAPTLTTFGLDFNFRPNALPTKPLPSAPPPVYAGATPGSVGLYQVNFIVPPVPDGTLPVMLNRLRPHRRPSQT